MILVFTNQTFLIPLSVKKYLLISLKFTKYTSDKYAQQYDRDKNYC